MVVERLLLQPILDNSLQPRVCTCSTLEDGIGPKINAPDVKDFANLDGVLWHLITLRNFSLTLTNVTTGDKVMGILVDGGPHRILNEDFSGCVLAPCVPQ
ncbi:hypothetical protein Tco_0826805 [Tanacetum coccineum]